MKTFDEAFSKIVLERLAKLSEDATPDWGTMSPGKLFGHLNGVLLYTMGERPGVPYRGNFKTRYLYRPILLLGIRELPRNLKLPRPQGVSDEQLFPVVPLDEMAVSVDRYLAAASTGALLNRMHPLLGDLSASQWQRFHRIHFTHHMKQFGLGDDL